MYIMLAQRLEAVDIGQGGAARMQATNGQALPGVVCCCLEATEGFEPSHGGLAGPDSGEKDPCSPFAGFRIGVCVFSPAWRTQTLVY